MRVVPSNVESLTIIAESDAEEFVLRMFIQAWKQGRGDIGIIPSERVETLLISNVSGEEKREDLSVKIQRFFKRPGA